MTTQAATTTDDKTKETPAGGTAPAGGGTGAPENKVAPTTQQQAAPADKKDPPAGGGTNGAPPPATPKLLADDDDEIDDKAPYQISGANLKKRLGRFSKSYLRQQFGTDDPESIKGQLAKLKELEKADDERKRAEMSEKQRLEDDLKKERERAEKAEAERQAAIDERMADQEGRRIDTIAAKHIDADLLDEATRKFALYLHNEVSESEMASLTDKDIEAWFEGLAKERPKYAKASTTTTEEKPPPETRGITNGGSGGGPRPKPLASTQTGADQKTARPGQPNSMTKEEIRKLGYNW